MIQLSRMTDYGLLVLTRLAGDKDVGLWSARDLAEVTDLPLPTVSKVLKTLTRAGILQSQRGAQGGYGLARDPAQIKIAEVIRTFEGPIALTVCSEGPGKCDLEHQCAIRSPLQVVNDAIRGTLESLDLATILTPRPNVAVQFANAAVQVADAANETPHDHADLKVRTGER